MSTSPSGLPFRTFTQADLQDPDLTNLNQQFRQLFQAIQTQNSAIVNPATAQVAAVGSTPQSVVTPFTVVADGTAGSVGIYWDGTNGSLPLQIRRSDGTITGPIYGNKVCFGLKAGQNYFFYSFYQEDVSDDANAGGEGVGVQFASVSGYVGTTRIAYSTANLVAAQQRIMRDHVPLGIILASTGVTLPASGRQVTSG
jgi:hypothetical protein